MSDPEERHQRQHDDQRNPDDTPGIRYGVSGITGDDKRKNVAAP
jgi:hypothetical protein